MCRHEIEQGNWYFYESQIDYIEQLMRHDPRDPYQYIIEIKSKYYEYKQDFRKALEYKKRSVFVSDSLRNLRDKNYLSQHEYNDLWEKENYDKEQLERQKTRLATISLLAILFTLIIIGIMTKLFIQFIKRRNIEHKNFETRQSNIELELLHAQKGLDKTMKEIADKNEIIRHFQRLKKSKEAASDDENQIIDQLSYTKILTNEDWLAFKTLFSEVYPNFMITIIQKNPSITEAELRMACMIRLNLSNEEIANMLGISKDAARKTSLRLRVRLNMPKNSHEDLVQFIYSLEV